MNLKTVFAVLFIVLIPTISYSQDCDCESNFEWVKKTIEENDAGFQYIIDKKGQRAYDLHNLLISEKIKEAKDLKTCTGLLIEWLSFFRKGHLGIGRLKYDSPAKSENENSDNKSYETVDIDIPKYEEYIRSKKEADYEGIWKMGDNTIGIKKEGKGYVGFIIESIDDTWQPGQVKFKIVKDGDKIIESTFYMYDHSPCKIDAMELIGNNYLLIGSINPLKRLSPIFPTEPSVERYLKSTDTQKPYLEELNATTLYLRIPSFYTREPVDSVIMVHKDRILKTENLIIDIRNNGGGTDLSWFELRPFLYTNPIRTVWVERLSTKQNNQVFLEYKKEWEYNQLEQHLGEFVNLYNRPIDIYTYPTIHVYPKNVGILIDEGVASAAEQFLLAAKQSKKVKLFGTSTKGELDISNMIFVESPSKEFRLRYGSTRSLRIPGMTIDDIGIQPDYYLDKSIPHYKWVDFVNEVLNQKE